jgi:hypothetical protein
VTGCAGLAFDAAVNSSVLAGHRIADFEVMNL